MTDIITRAAARLREVIVEHYRLIYEVFPDRVEIISVMHGRRNLNG